MPEKEIYEKFYCLGKKIHWQEVPIYAVYTQLSGMLKCGKETCNKNTKEIVFGILLDKA